MTQRLLDIGVLGASGLGAPIIEFAARDNYNSLLIVDNDKIDTTNLNRLPATRTESIGKPKACHYRRYAKKINPSLKVKAYHTSFYRPRIQKEFSLVDIAVGAVDSAARLSLNRLALANLIPYFDLGAGIYKEDNKLMGVGGQVYVTIPGREACLNCSGVFRALEKEFMSKKKREIERRQGYLVGDNENGTDAPLVMFLDYAVAGLGYYQLLKYVWGTMGPDTFCVNLDLEQNTQARTGTLSKGCIWCQKTGLLT